MKIRKWNEVDKYVDKFSFMFENGDITNMLEILMIINKNDTRVLGAKQLKEIK